MVRLCPLRSALTHRFVVPSDDEIALVLDVLDLVASPALDKLEKLLETAGSWDNVARNDFCR
jgi:proteasome activator subunit 4